MKKIIKKVLTLVFCAVMMITMLSGCGSSKEEILIYSAAEDYRIEYMQQRLNEQFPDYDITIEYMSTGNAAAKLMSEGTATECDILYSVEYGYMEQLDKAGIFAELTDYDMSVFTEDTRQSNSYVVDVRNGGAIIVNTEVLAEKGLAKPTCYEDLLKPEYKGLISMPNPKSSGTGYMFLKSLVNEWGEEEAFAYFEQLTPNVLQYTSSGSGPVNALVQGEVAVGLGMTAQAVTQINEGAPLELIFFEEGAPYSLYGEAIINGKKDRACVDEVFRFMVEVVNYEMVEKYFPEKIYVDVDYEVENYPKNVEYCDMSNNSSEEKTRLLEKWVY